MISHESKVALEKDVPSGDQLSTFSLFRATEMDNAPSVCFHQCRHVFIAFLCRNSHGVLRDFDLNICEFPLFYGSKRSFMRRSARVRNAFYALIQQTPRTVGLVYRAILGFGAVAPLQRTGSVRPWLTAVCSQSTLTPTMKPPRAPQLSRSTKQKVYEQCSSPAPEGKRATS